MITLVKERSRCWITSMRTVHKAMSVQQVYCSTLSPAMHTGQHGSASEWRCLPWTMCLFATEAVRCI